MRIVLDTNQLVRALMRPPALATFMMAWQSNRFTVFASPALIAEYERVLLYPEIAPLIATESMRAFRSHLLHNIRRITPPITPPVCRDPDDDKVIAVAIYSRVDCLVTDDSDLLTREIVTLLNQFDIRVLSIDSLIQMLDKR